MSARKNHVSPDAPLFFECPGCGHLSDDPGFGRGEAPCPECGSLTGGRRTFPTDRVRRLDSRIRHYYEEGEYEIVVILVATFLETVLEDMIDRLLVTHGADMEVRRMLLDSQRSIGVRLGKVFPQLTGHGFEETASTFGFTDFPERWREIRQARNAFIHDAPFHGPGDDIDIKLARQSMMLLDAAYKLFVKMNNRFAVGAPKTETE